MSNDSASPSTINPDDLLAIIGPSPADNREGYDTAVLWKSEIVARQVKEIFKLKQRLGDIADQGVLFGPLSLVAGWQKSFLETWITQPAETLARILGATGSGPDLFIEQNEWIEQTYARLLRERCGLFMKNGTFNRAKASGYTESEQGMAFLENSMREFAMLEQGYHSRGLTRLKALKDLLQCLLMLITGKTLAQAELPFKPKSKNGFDRQLYLKDIQTRLENLHTADAFDSKAFSVRLTGGKIGCSPFEIIEESRLYASTLRFYPLPDGIEPNGKIIYLPSPLVNKPEIYDLAKGKSVIEGMHKNGYTVYLVDNGDPGYEESKLGLDFYGKTLHDNNLEIIARRHPGQEISVIAYCMGGTLILPYLARRAEERLARGDSMDIHKVVTMASPVNIDDAESGYAPVLEIIRQGHDPRLIEDLFGDVNIPVQVIESGMNQTQFGVQYYVSSGFYDRALDPDALLDSAPFFFWLSHGRMFPARAHKEWIQQIFLENRIYRGRFCLPSSVPALDGQPVRMDVLTDAGVTIMDYRGTRDMISPGGACVASETWGQTPDHHLENPPGGMNQTVEKNIGHIFVVSRRLLAEFIDTVSEFLGR